jgi:hypothetical protein
MALEVQASRNRRMGLDLKPNSHRDRDVVRYVYVGAPPRDECSRQGSSNYVIDKHALVSTLHQHRAVLGKR